MPDNIELASDTRATDSTQSAAHSLAQDAYRPSDAEAKKVNSDSSKKDDSAINSLFGSVHLFDSSTDQITVLNKADKDGNVTEAMGVGPIKVETADPFDWHHPIDSAKTFLAHPIDSVTQHVEHQVEAVKDLYERVTGSDKPAESKGPYDGPEKQQVEELQSKITDPVKKAAFDKDMADFEKRAGDAHPPLDAKEVADTYKQIGRLMEAPDSKVGLSSEERLNVAEQILHHAAHPDRIDQGNHDTCAAAALESQIFTKDPAAAAKLIADVSIDGQYHDKDGNAVIRDPNGVAAKDAHNMDYPLTDNQRSMASQIFQTTAATMEYPDYKQDKPEQKGPDDTGERIGNDKDFPGLTNDQVRDIARRITGTDNGDTVIANVKDKGDSSMAGGGVFVASPEELGQQLSKLKEAHKLPAIISVDSRNEPFFSDSKGNVAGGSGGPHDVTIKDYIAGPPAQVVVENQWGKDSEHTMTVDKLYYATLAPGDHQTIEALKEQVGPKPEDPNVDPRLKLELLRQEHLATDPNDQISSEQYQKQVAKVMVEAEKRWQQQSKDGKVDEEERRQTWFKFDELAIGAHANPADSAAISRDIGANLKAENDLDLVKQLISDQQRYSKDFVASLNAEKGHSDG